MDNLPKILILLVLNLLLSITYVGIWTNNLILNILSTLWTLGISSLVMLYIVDAKNIKIKVIKNEK